MQKESGPIHTAPGPKTKNKQKININQSAPQLPHNQHFTYSQNKIKNKIKKNQKKIRKYKKQIHTFAYHFN